MRMKLNGESHRTIKLPVATPGISQHIADPFIPMTLHLVLPGGASGRVEYSTDGNLSWRPWAAGDVSVSTEAVISFPVSGVRCRILAGSGELNVVT